MTVDVLTNSMTAGNKLVVEDVYLIMKQHQGASTYTSQSSKSSQTLLDEHNSVL